MKRDNANQRLGRLESWKFAIYADQRRHIEMLWNLVSQPVKFPNRRRREDRELPKKAA